MASPIHPIYETNRANESLSLWNGAVEVVEPSGRIHKGLAIAQLHFAPRYRLVITVDLPTSPKTMFSLGTSSKVKFCLDAMTQHEEAIVIRSHISVGKDPKTVLELLPTKGRVTVCPDKQERLASVIFHILNFPEFFSFGIKPENMKHVSINEGRRTFSTLGRTVLTASPWQIEIQAHPSIKQLVEQLKAEGGYAITHMARLSRISGKTFAVSQADQILNELRQFLSFARGHWTPIFGVVGANPSCVSVYTDWTTTLGTPWEPRSSWFDEHHGQCLSELFEGFLGLLQDKVHGTSVSNALYWYLRSNRAREGSGIDSGIILSQAALERLAGAYLAKNGLPVTGNAAARMRRAFQHPVYL